MFFAVFVAIICSGLFAGAAVYVTFVEHPARMECGTELAATEFGPSYRRATVMQALLVAIASVAALLAWRATSEIRWLVGAIVIGAVIPFTLIVIFPTNKKLLDPSLDRSSEAARKLLIKWGRLHAVRTALGVGALLILLCPVYATSVRQAKESVLQRNLFQMRSLISQYTLDKQKAPQALEDLVTAGYLKQLPVDPMTGKADWQPVQGDVTLSVDQQDPGIDDVHSSSTRISSDGTAYNTW
jgi:uncharacterized membrane protein